MIKKFIGVIVTLAVLAVIVFAVLGAGTYSSMLPEGWLDGSVELSVPTQTDVVE